MALPQPDTTQRDAEGADTVVLLPLRSLRDGKQRLRSSLYDEQRAVLITAMAQRVLDAAHGLPVLVVHDDPEVAEWAIERKAQALRPTESGLNPAVSAGRDLLASQGFGRIIVAHADLPLALDLRVMLGDDPISIAPDSVGDGTNVLCVPADLPFPFEYGPGSFERHRATARRFGIEPRIVDAPDLAIDVDDPSDLHVASIPQLLQQESP